MTISTLDGLNGANKQQIIFSKSNDGGSVERWWWTGWPIAGVPTSGSAPANTTAGVVPTNLTTGAPTIASFTGNYYIKDVGGTSSTTGTVYLYDRLFHAGAYSFNASQALTSQPSYSSRLPGTVYDNLEIWCEVVTNMTGALAVTVQYTNEAGTTGRSTESFSLPSGAVAKRAFRLPLQAGDKGVQTISNVVGATASVGTFNIVIARPLGLFKLGPVVRNPTGEISRYDFLDLGLSEVYPTSCLSFMFKPDNNGGAGYAGVFDVNIVNG